MPPDKDFHDLVRRARRGDERAWTQLFGLISGRVVGFLVTRGTPDPEDVAAEVFADVVRSLKRFEGGQSEFISWTLTIAHRRRVDALRQRHRRPESPEPVEVLDTPDRDADVEASALGLVEAAAVRRLLDRLTPDQVDVLTLRIYGDLSLPEVAKTLDKPLTAVTSLQHRGLEALRRMLIPEELPEAVAD